jgi:hypothetical protein
MQSSHFNEGVACMRHFQHVKMLVTLFPSTSVHEENFVLSFFCTKTPV